MGRRWAVQWFLDLPGVLFQKVAAIGLLHRDVPLGEQGKYPANGGAGDIEGLGEGLLAQWLAGLHRPGADHLDDARGQLQGEIFLYHRLYSEWLSSVDPADSGRTGGRKIPHTDGSIRMLKFNAHLGFQFNELPFLQRIEAAAAAGFRAVEFPSPYEFDASLLADQLAQYGLPLVQFAAPAGVSKGIAAVAGKEPEFRDGLRQAVSYARALACADVHLMSGVTHEDGADKVYASNPTMP